MLGTKTIIAIYITEAIFVSIVAVASTFFYLTV